MNAERPTRMFLKPGEIVIMVEHPVVVMTILGSCVSITMFCKRLKAGAICHALLPGNGSAGRAGYHVDASIKIMLTKIYNYGIQPPELEVKLFGGADTVVV